ncbi:hypothetical protein ACQPW3_13555 [Actinosynnema sp. CA-248983]
MFVPVIARSLAESFTLWPLSDGDYWVPVGGAMTSEQVGTALHSVLMRCADFAPPGTVAQAALPDMLSSAQRDLVAFLDLTAVWADRHAPGRGAELVRALDRSLTISAPL